MEGVVTNRKIKGGMKQTEVGVIPIDWSVRNLGDITTSIASGKSDTKSNYGDYPIYGSTGLIGYNSKFDYSGETILVARVGANAGTVNTVTGKYCVSDNTLIIELGKSLNFRFIQYYLKYYNLNKLVYGSGQPLITGGQLKLLKIPLPPTKAEQTAIATALSDADALIRSLEKLIAKKRLIKQGAMQELLKPKEGWVVKKLGEVGRTYGGLTGKSKKDFEDGNYPYIPFMNVMSNVVTDKNYLDYVKIKSGEGQNKVQQGDLIFNGSSETPEEVGMCSVLLDEIPILYLNSFCFGFRLYDELNNDGLFLSYYFRSEYGRKKFFSLAQGATRYNLSKKNFLQMDIELPTPVEQRNISAILLEMDKEIKALESKLEKYKQIKQGMMQNLLTGRIRLV